MHLCKLITASLKNKVFVRERSFRRPLNNDSYVSVVPYVILEILLQHSENVAKSAEQGNLYISLIFSRQVAEFDINVKNKK